MSIVNIGKWHVPQVTKQVCIPSHLSLSVVIERRISRLANTILYHYLGQNRGGNRTVKPELYTTPIYWTTQNNKTTIRYAGYTRDPENVVIHGDLEGEFKFVAYYIVDGYVRAVAQSKYDPLSSEVAEVFHHKRNIRKEDIEHDMFGYRKYLDFQNKKPE